MKPHHLFILFFALTSMLMACQKPCTNCANESSTAKSNITVGSEVTTADIKVRKLTVVEKGDTLILTTEIGNEGDDDARETKATILLPAEANVYSFIANNAVVKGSQCQGYVRFDIGNLNTARYAEQKGTTSDRVVLTIKTSKCKQGYEGKESFGVFANNLLPDFNPENNYCFWKNGQTKCCGETSVSPSCEAGCIDFEAPNWKYQQEFPVGSIYKNAVVELVDKQKEYDSGFKVSKIPKLESQSLLINHATLGIDFKNCTMQSVSFDFYEGKSISNVLEINEKQVSVESFLALDGKSINGLKFSVVKTANNVDKLTINGSISSLSLSGVELSIDNLCWK